MDPTEINDAFSDYYKDLYNIKNETNVRNMNRFLDSLSMIQREHKEDLERDERLGTPDGLPIDLY